MNNKWTIKQRNEYSLGDETICITHNIVIPPTSGNRTDIIDSDGVYHYGMTKKMFTERISKEEYLNQCLPGLNDKEREQALKEIDWTPRRFDKSIDLIIEINQGKVTLKR